jgi:hypothetical protein
MNARAAANHAAFATGTAIAPRKPIVGDRRVGF